MNCDREKQMKAFGRLLDVLDVLRDECPWDKKQTNQSLRPNTIEEVYELCDALVKDDTSNICKELGDVLLHVCFYAKIADEDKKFDIADVCNMLTDKLIYRHPHIYAPTQIGKDSPVPLSSSEFQGQDKETTTAEEVLVNWEQLKLREKDGNKGVLSGVPEALPSLIKAFRVQEKAANVGFDWPDKSGVWNKVEEELAELKAELDVCDKVKAEQEFGDFLFSLINVCRHFKINPDNALEQTNKKFVRRFEYIEKKAAECNKKLNEMSLEQMDELWNEAKLFE